MSIIILMVFSCLFVCLFVFPSLNILPLVPVPLPKLPLLTNPCSPNVLTSDLLTTLLFSYWNLPFRGGAYGQMEIDSEQSTTFYLLAFEHFILSDNAILHSPL